MDETSGGADVLDATKAVIGQIKALSSIVSAEGAAAWPSKEADLSAAEDLVAAEDRRLTNLIASLQAS